MAPPLAARSPAIEGLRAIPFLALVFYPALSTNAQEQQPKYQTGWPCPGRVDSSSIRTAEATGGKVFLFTPNEVTGVADDLSASTVHKETVFRAGGQLADGVHEFEVALDSTIESAYFFIALQCQHFMAVLQPSGDELLPDGVCTGRRRNAQSRRAAVGCNAWTVRLKPDATPVRAPSPEPRGPSPAC